MKKGIFFLLLAASFTAKSQSLKDLLYSGKLKMDSNTVIRKTDDLSSKIDTSQKKPDVKASVVSIPADTAARITNSKISTKDPVPVTNQPAPIANPNVNVKDTSTGTLVETSTANEPEPRTEVAPSNVPAKTNNKIWKEYTDSIATGLKNEVLSSKKIKKDTYFFLVDYELAPDGTVTITNVTVSPENKELQAQVSQRMDAAGPPHMNPIPNSTPTTKKAKRRYSFSVTKD